MRRSLRLTMKNLNYESPIKCLRQQTKEKRQVEESSSQTPAKRQKTCRGNRDSVIIIDENDIINTNNPKRRKKDVVADDSVIIIDDINPESHESRQSEDLTVVYSSISTAQNKRKTPQFSVDKNGDIANLKLLKGDYPQKWLGEWLAEKRKNIRKNNLKSKRNLKRRKSKLLTPIRSTREKENKRKKGKIASPIAIDDEEIEEIEENEKKEKEEKEQKEKREKELEKRKKEKEEKENKKEKISKKTNTSNGELREVIIDGPNVAKAYTNGRYFSETGLKLVIDFFLDKGHKVKAFVPQHVRNRNRQVLEDLNRAGLVIFTPSRKAGSKVITPYDDRYILEYANKCNGIIISNDQFKDLYAEKPEWRETIEKCILPPTFVGDHLMFPEDPLGRNGPKLHAFLRHQT